MSETCRIRLARPPDATRIAVMSRDLIEYGFVWKWTPMRVVRHIRNATSNVAAAWCDGNLAGFGIMAYADDEAHLLLFGVHPVYRRRGVGSMLLAWLEHTVSTAQLELIFLEARAGNTAARAFYRARGYRELAILPRYYSGREDAVCIGKDLAAAPRADVRY